MQTVHLKFFRRNLSKGDGFSGLHCSRIILYPPTPQQNGSRPSASSPLRLSSTNYCFNCGDLNHCTRECPQVRHPNQDQGSGQNKKNKGKKQTVQVRQAKIDFTPLGELPEGAPVMTETTSLQLYYSVLVHHTFSLVQILVQYWDWISITPKGPI